jgi:glycosyltransferase involved in cell wall biosynthesis
LELPYSLAQDSTLFLVLEETTPEIWLRKLDWIAGHGGMALVNVHPDYLDFSGQGRGKDQYPAAFYADFLRHVTTSHTGLYWNALPRDVTTWDQETNSRSGGASAPTTATAVLPPAPVENPDLRGKRVAVLLYSSYPSDPRPRRAAEALAHQGAEVEIICLRQDPAESPTESINGVKVRRLPHKHRRGGKLTYVSQYFGFILATFFILSWRTLRKRYQLVHVHNMPDVLVFSALGPRLCGAKVILDLHDPMPELMMTIFGSGGGRRGISLLKKLEKWSIGFADAVLTVNQACKDIFSARSCRPEKVAVVMNSPDEEIFQFKAAATTPPAATDAARPFVIMYHGSIVERHGLDLAVTAVARVRRTFPGVQLHIYGRRTPFLDQVLASVQEANLSDAVRYLGPKNLEQIVAAIAESDVGIIPNRRSIFTEINTPTRIFEYLSQARPVIAPRAPGITDYFGPEDLVFFELGDAVDLADKIEYLIRHPAETLHTVRRGQQIYLSHNWSRERLRLLGTIARLLRARDWTATERSTATAAIARGGG